MDRIKLSDWEQCSMETQIVRCMTGINQLIDEVNKVKKRLDKRDEGIKKMVARIKHDLYDENKGEILEK